MEDRDWNAFASLVSRGQAQFKEKNDYVLAPRIAYDLRYSTHQTEVCGFYGVKQVDNARLDLATHLMGLVMFKKVGPQEAVNLTQQIRSTEVP